ncbi:NACHT domain-containing protein [Kordia jejudonensis]|uniref:NACHT domain-containing protein n=1 Tax=Kordia jejudonensis TaxID=1348245 RepID=UPI0006291A02|nr:NACHT domain-containing protein [Kordia jejudonensis]
MVNPRAYLVSDIKKLFSLTGNQCSAPNCTRSVVGEDGNTLVGKICHIEAASPNGPRYRLEMTNEQRRAYDNLILLCDEHHSIIDNKRNEGKFPVALLKQWREEHIAFNEFKNQISKEDLQHLLTDFYTFKVEEYVKKNIYDQDFKSIDRVYVELLGEEGYDDIEVVGLEKMNEYDLLRDMLKPDSLLDIDIENEDDIDDEEIKERRIDSILTIVNDTPHVHIIGNPGSGKSTTLQKIVYKNSEKINAGNTHIKIPFLLEAKDYSKENSFRQMLEEKASKDWIANALKLGELHILIDGLNEIDVHFETEAYEELLYLLHTYPENSFVVSERKKNHTNRFSIPVFELKELNEKQIKKFIQNHINTDPITIWNALEKNTSMLNLAYNPLTLRMIISVIKQNKTIPANKGSLFNAFIRCLYKLEIRKKEKSRIIREETKFDFLAEIAFIMRSKGVVSISLLEFKDLILKIIPKYNSNYAVNHVYNELIDNLIVKVNANQNISFFHETYQEFFAAIYLKNAYVVHKKLAINVADVKWFESILMCSDLLDSKQLYMSFLTYLFAGQTDEKPTFSIKNNKINATEFTEKHFNPHIILPCKIAYYSKTYRSEMYDLAETYLYNTLLLWKYIYIKDKKMVLPLDVIFGAISSLDSEKLINYVFKNLWWIYNWFYSAYEEKNNHFFSNTLPVKKLAKEKEESDVLIFKAIGNHTPNFIKFYTAVDKAIQTYSFSRSIHWRFKRLKTSITRERSENELIKFLNNEWDYIVFSSLIRFNLEEIYRYNFEENTRKYNYSVLKTIVSHHVNKPLAQEILLRELKRDAYEAKLVKKILNKFLHLELYDALFELVLSIKDHHKDLFKKYIKIIKTFPFEVLSDELKAFFTKGNVIVSIPYRLTSLSNNIQIDKKYLQYIINGHENVTINDKFQASIRTIEDNFVDKNVSYSIVFHNKRFVHPTSATAEENEDSTPIKHNATLEVRKVKEDLLYYLKPTHKQETIGVQWFNSLKKKKATIQIKNQKGSKVYIFKKPQFKYIEGVKKTQFSREKTFLVTFKKQQNTPRSQMLKANESATSEQVINLVIRGENGNSATKEGTLTCYNNFLFSMKKETMYHPDVILANPNLVSYMDRNYDRIISFINSLGISYRYHKHIKNIHYGIVTNITENYIKYFSLQTQKFYSKLRYKFDQNIYKQEDVIIIEETGFITIINDPAEAKLTKIGYIESTVVALGYQEGFIKNNLLSKDYYFNFSSCDFIPQIGDTVRFLPAKNFYASNENQPIALKISLLKRTL